MGTEADLNTYQREQLREFHVWQKLLDTWCSSRSFTLFKVGQGRMDSAMGRFIVPHMCKNIYQHIYGRSGLQALQPMVP